jgi:predicted RND superfamily exporter protein
VGLCLDDNIHIGNSLRHGSPSLQEILRNTGGAICFTSLTNMVGMGSMALAPIPLLKQAGIFVVLALAWELLASLFFLPALLRLLKGVKP